ncbi:putative Leucine--tRNA ligase, chloroplastic/mitochondrial [Cocos nucifera]|uniref:leucine--tRNA ligase n=1 Tax=Cocos nucifera TaxID=13894 RepID=A0A8K0I2Z0_COCNU|nr:putative Leucine--tRNA ligase, chloroplastic/mitochondrial [Cocos nucifera]
MQAPIQTRAPLRIQSLPSASTLRFSLPFVVLRRTNRRPVRVRCCATGCGNNPRPPAQQQRRSYPFDEIEPRWHRYWEENRTFRTPDEVDTSKPKCYILDMFPYPRQGLIRRSQQSEILNASGLRYLKEYLLLFCPKKDYANNAKFFLKSSMYILILLKSLGFSYDWDREISTTEPEYYKWTQWIFLQLLKKGLAYQAEVPVNWCPALATVLANEEVVNGVSERGGYPVIRKPMRQWMLKITAYADRLLEDLDELDWSESIKEMQQNWIGRSEGAELKFNVVSTQGCEQGVELPVYTTRPDTIFGATYLVLAPEHHLLPSLISEAQHESVEEYRDLAAKKSELERTDLQKEKSGVFSGSYAKNPATGEVIPIWIADYVLGSYGTGAIMAVPAHDSRDHEFALKYIIPIIRVVSPFDESCDLGGPYLGDGVMVNSSNSVSGLNINGLSCKDAASEVINWLERTGYGKKKVNYKLRDWLFARQRYWGEPFPVIYLDDTGEVVPLPENELPLTLPELDDFTPTGTGEPPLAKATSWVKTMDPISGRPAKREMSTMPQWAGSCW